MQTSGGAPSGILIDTVRMSEDMMKMRAGSIERYAVDIFTYEDLKQEAWLAVAKASGYFDPTKTRRPITFFNVATENAFKNLKRDFQRKSEFINPISLPTDRLDYTFEGSIIANDLYDFLSSNMPPSLLPDFENLVRHGGETLSSQQKSKVRQIAAILIKRYNDE